jgi:hypothetical protein
VHLNHGSPQNLGCVAHLATDFGLGSRQASVIQGRGSQHVTELLS